MKIWEIEGFTRELFDDMVSSGFVNVRPHPTLPLRIMNYSDRCQVNWVWNDVTMNTRGLIVDADDNIVARAFPKFFNHNQSGAVLPEADETITVTDKVDGSLGILWSYQGHSGIATRGSFVSDQAVHASQMPYVAWTLDHQTVVVEIVYAQNRIVVDYGDEDKLVLLGVVDNNTGHVTEALQCYDKIGWPKEWVVEQYSYKTLTDVFASAPRANREGFVIRGNRTGNTVKYKYEDYIRLHKIVYGLSEKSVWEYMGAHDYSVDGLLEELPDELYSWTEQVEDRLGGELNHLGFEANKQYKIALSKSTNADMTIDRKKFASIAVTCPDVRPYMFMLLDGRDPKSAIWKSLKPKNPKSAVMHSEDVA